jgi:hypothetical protein
MRLRGWCERCHRIRVVRVNTAWHGKGIPVGECDDCREKREARRVR